MVGAIGSSLAGLSAGLERVDRAAGRIAQDGAGDRLAGHAVDLLRARHDVRANLAVLRAADELTGTILDVFA